MRSSGKNEPERSFGILSVTSPTEVARPRSRYVFSTVSVGHEVHGAPRALLEHGGDVTHVAEGGAHQQELCTGQGEQRHLPGPAAVGVGVEVELVHHDAAHL